MNTSEFAKELYDISKEIHENNVQHGFWNYPDKEDVTVRLSKLALIVSEVGEAIEAVRDNNMDNLSEELADIIIRILDFAYANRIFLGAILKYKIDKNKDRPYMHGRLA